MKAYRGEAPPAATPPNVDRNPVGETPLAKAMCNLRSYHLLKEAA